MNTNVCVFSGHVVADAQTKKVGESILITNFSLAVNERRKKNDGTGSFSDYPNFLDMVIFGNYGEVMRPLLKKGMPVTATARVHQDRWEKDGGKFSRVVFYCDNIQLHNRREKAVADAPSEVSTLQNVFGDNQDLGDNVF